MEYIWPVIERFNIVSDALLTALNSRADDWFNSRKFYQIVTKQSVEDIPEYKEYKDNVMSNLNTFSKIFPNSRYNSNSNYVLNSSLVIACPWFRQVRHVDSSDKAFSLVTYCNDNNQGTKIHSDKRKGTTQIVPWVKGKTIVFAPGPSTWHSWSSNSNWRVTLISFVTYSS